jgi:hypothetical protein
VTVPIPDATKLLKERGLFWFSAGTQATNGSGYTLWFDEIKFEKLGTIGNSRPSIFNGADVKQTGFFGLTIPITGLTQIVNLASGRDQAINVAPSFYNFKSTDTMVAVVDKAGLVTIVGDGDAIITATLAGVPTKGSLTVSSVGNFQLAPTPARDPNKVISIFSDHYTNVTVDFYNGYWEPWQTTVSNDFAVAGNNMLGYSKFNFVGIQFATPTVDATTKNNLHLNMYIPENVPANLDFLITIKDFGADKKDGGTDDTKQLVYLKKPAFTADTWKTVEIPLTLANKNNIGQIIMENVNGSTLTDFYLDNIYFYQN